MCALHSFHTFLEPRYNRNRAERKSKDYSSTEDVTTSGGEYNEESNKSASHTKSTVVKTLTYTKTSDSSSNDSEFSRNVHKTSKKAKDRRIETEETSEESDELGSRNELVVMKLAEQGGDIECNSEDETTSSRVVPAARRDEVVGSQDDNPTSDGAVTRDDHDGYDFDRSEGGSRTNVYGLRSRTRSRSNKPGENIVFLTCQPPNFPTYLPMHLPTYFKNITVCLPNYLPTS